MELDQTTFYSILGLSSNATATEISKSYRKLAKKFHPDKSKLNNAETIFKIIVEAYAILSNEELKSKYDKELMLSGLYEYSPKDKVPLNNPFNAPVYHRRGMPYEQQPYGFGFETKKYDNMERTRTNKTAFKQPSSNKLKSFNIKTYQRNQKRYSNDMNLNTKINEKNNFGTNKNEKQNNTFTNSGHDDVNIDIQPNFPSNANINKDFNHAESHCDLSYKDSGKKHIERNFETTDNLRGEEQSTFDDESFSKKQEHSFSVNNEEGNIEDIKGSRSKLHKPEHPSRASTHLEQPLPNWDYAQRQRFRTKQKNKESLRRSTSPIKMASTNDNISINDEWNNSIREIIEKMKNIDQTTAKATNTTNIHTKRREDFAFDLGQIDESLESIPIPSPKRSKTMGNDSFLHKPVNITLPRIYKEEIIQEEKTFINLEILKRESPKLPNFQIDLSNPLELENCKEDISRFITNCNILKRDIMSIYMNRLMFDMENKERLLRIENIGTWLKCRQYDSELANKIQELEYKQSMIIHAFNNMISGIYSSKPT